MYISSNLFQVLTSKPCLDLTRIGSVPLSKFNLILSVIRSTLKAEIIGPTNLPIVLMLYAT